MPSLLLGKSDTAYTLEKFAIVALVAAVVAVLAVLFGGVRVLEPTARVMVPTASAVKALPWIALWFLIAWIARLTRQGWADILLVLVAPLVFNIDLVTSGLYTVRAFRFEQINFVEVGFWRVVLATFAVAFAMRDIERGFSLWYCNLGFLLMVTLLYAIIGCGIMCGHPPWEPAWLFARYLELASTFTFASMVSIFASMGSVAASMGSTLTPAGAIFMFLLSLAYIAVLTFAATIAGNKLGWIGQNYAIRLFPDDSSRLFYAEQGANVKPRKKPRMDRGSGATREASPVVRRAEVRAEAQLASAAHEQKLAAEPSAEEGPIVEEPSPFSYFCSDDGKAAREAANRKGLVALFCGPARWSLCGGKYEFFAIPEELASKLLSGKALTAEEKRMLARWIQSGEIAEAKTSWGWEYTLVKSKDLESDMKEQIKRIKALTEQAKSEAPKRPDYVV